MLHTTTKAPSLSTAIDYVRAHFAGWDVPPAVFVVGSIAPGRDSSGAIEGSRDVLFFLDGETGRPNRFTVWHDEAAGGLYGEW